MSLMFSYFQLISLPSCNDRGAVTYNFGLSAEEGGPNKQGRTDFLSSTNSTLTSLGSQTEILRVKASESQAFERIGRRFKDDKLEKEKNSTVLLDNKDKKRATVPKPKTVVRKVTSLPQQSSSRTLSGGASGSSHGSSSTSHPPSSYSGLGPGRGQSLAPPPASHPRSHSPMSRQAHHHHSAPANNSPSQPPAPPASHSQMPPAGSRTGFPPSSSAPPRPRPQVNTEIMKRPLRERLIHLLAVRPYKKLEILPRMNKDGLKEKDKKSITNLLREVSDCKNNSYELRRSMWNEVSEDWPFYTEQDRVIVRRRKPQNLTPPGSDTGSTSSGHSPSSTNPPSPPQITNPLKRTSFYDVTQREAAPNPKKVRVSGYKRPGAPSLDMSRQSPSSLLMPGSGGSGDHRGHGVSLSPRLDMEYDKVEDDSAPNWDKWGREHGQQPSPGREAPHPVTAAQAESPERPGGSQMQQLVPNRNMDFLAAYTTIVTKEQRIKYKAEFNQEYAKYRKHHNVLDQVSKRFAHLETKLKQHQRGSEGFKDVKARIYVEYERNKGNREYQDARSNFQYLHEKLAHIKKLVHDYDTAGVAAR